MLLTGLSRSVGIAVGVARHLVDAGWSVSATGWPAHDAEMPWGVGERADVAGLEHWAPVDLSDPGAPAALVHRHLARVGHLDAVVAVHARSAGGDLMTVDAADLDACWAVNARASVLLTQAALRAGASRVVLFTTGVHQRPMPEEIAYATSKAALQGITASLASTAAAHGATVNCVNPGPVDTGYADDELRESIAGLMPTGRWGSSADVAPVVTWLLSEEAAWVTGQTLDVDGGWGVRP